MTMAESAPETFKPLFLPLFYGRQKARFKPSHSRT